MIVIKAYAHGAGIKVRLEQHNTCCPDGGCGEPDQDATERAYPPRGASPKETSSRVSAAVGRLWRAHSNKVLADALCYQEKLPGL